MKKFFLVLFIIGLITSCSKEDTVISNTSDSEEVPQKEDEKEEEKKDDINIDSETEIELSEANLYGEWDVIELNFSSIEKSGISGGNPDVIEITGALTKSSYKLNISNNTIARTGEYTLKNTIKTKFHGFDERTQTETRTYSDILYETKISILAGDRRIDSRSSNNIELYAQKITTNFLQLKLLEKHSQDGGNSTKNNTYTIILKKIISENNGEEIENEDCSQYESIDENSKVLIASKEGYGFNREYRTNWESLMNQEEIDTFSKNKYTKIIGDLEIQNADDLSGLCSLQKIEGNLEIYIAKLENLEGLNNLKNIEGDLILHLNDNLLSLDGLNNLKSIGGSLVIVNNYKLTNLSSLSNLENISDDLIVFGLNSDFLGLEKISSVNNLKISAITKIKVGTSEHNVPDKYTPITSFKGLDNLKTIRGSITIKHTNINNFQHLNSLESIASEVSIYDNNNLIDFTGLEKITVINDNFYIVGNESLKNFNGLNNLKQINSKLRFSDNTHDRNSSLKNFIGFDNLEYINDIMISNSGFKGLPNLENFIGFNKLKTVRKLSLEIYNHPIITNPKLEFNGFNSLTKAYSFSIQFYNNDKTYKIIRFAENLLPNYDIEIDKSYFISSEEFNKLGSITH
ncbi:hypothetical protein [Wenyingzhuangia sp. IMCC45574]